MYQIDKQFDFCYGHRVWTQQLNPRFSIENTCKCRFCHGHFGVLKVGLKSETLKDSMVTDFKHLNFFKKILDKDFDHKFICDINDPLFKDIFKQFEDCKDAVIDKMFYKIIDPNKIPENLPPEVKEKMEGLVIVDFVPTSENLSRMFFQLIEYHIKELGVEVAFVDFWETPRSHCRYTRD